MIMRFGIFLNGMELLIARARSLITRIILSTSGTCSLADVVLRRTPSSIHLVFTGSNSPSARICVIRNPAAVYIDTTLLIPSNSVAAFRLTLYYTVINLMLRDAITKNPNLLTNMTVYQFGGYVNLIRQNSWWFLPCCLPL